MIVTVSTDIKNNLKGLNMKYYIPIYESPYNDGYYMELDDLMFPVLIKDNKAYIDNYSYSFEKESFAYPVIHKNNHIYIEVTLETINKTFRMSEEELKAHSVTF